MNGCWCGRGRWRMKKNRNISFQSNVEFFKPVGISMNQLDEVILQKDEVEAIRLKNIQKMDIIWWSEEMGISKSTFARIYNQAVDKLSDAIINSKFIRIEK